MIASKFELVLKSDTGETYLDWNYLTFFRPLLVKLSSYAIASINLPLLFIIGLNDRISKNDFPIVTISCYYVDQNLKRTKTIFIKKYSILKCINQKPITKGDQRIPCVLILSNPIFRQMYSKNGFNIVLTNATALNALSEYENYLQETYGDIFEFIKVGTQYQKNDYIYEQLLFKEITDLEVPVYLIHRYKPLHSFNTYFFDDFNLDIDKEIAAYHLNFYQCQQSFDRYDISQLPDISNQISIIKEYTLEDHFDKINKNVTSSTLTSINNCLDSTLLKQQISNILNMSGISKQEEQLYEGRKIKVQSRDLFLQNKTINQSTEHLNIYAHDSSDLVQTRFNVNRELFINQFKGTNVVRVNSDIPGWLNFDKIYNIDLTDPSKYAYIPLTVTNTFYRIAIREHYMTHATKAMFLELRN